MNITNTIYNFFKQNPDKNFSIIEVTIETGLKKIQVNGATCLLAKLNYLNRVGRGMYKLNKENILDTNERQVFFNTKNDEAKNTSSIRVRVYEILKNKNDFMSLSDIFEIISKENFPDGKTDANSKEIFNCKSNVSSSLANMLKAGKVERIGTFGTYRWKIASNDVGDTTSKIHTEKETVNTKINSNNKKASKEQVSKNVEVEADFDDDDDDDFFDDDRDSQKDIYISDDDDDDDDFDVDLPEAI